VTPGRRPGCHGTRSYLYAQTASRSELRLEPQVGPGCRGCSAAAALSSHMDWALPRPPRDRDSGTPRLRLPRIHDSLAKCADKKQCWCCLLSMLRIGRALGSEDLALGSVGNRRELSTATCLTEAGIEPGTVASELSEEHRSYFPCPMTDPSQPCWPVLHPWDDINHFGSLPGHAYEQIEWFINFYL
jgi:hypothetical protein